MTNTQKIVTMTNTQKIVIINWQNYQARCHFMARIEKENGDNESAIFWQREAARGHMFAVSNAERIA